MWSKRHFPVLVTLGCIIFTSMISGQTSEYPGYWRPKFEGFFDVNDTNSVPVVDRMNQYNVMKEMLYFTYQIEDAADNRIHFELHLGGSATFDSENDTTFLNGIISFKLNLLNPKIPNSRDIVDDIHKLQNLADMTGFQLPPRAGERIDEIRQNLEKYNKQFWWKRISVSASVPITDFDYLPGFDFQKTYLCLGYDFGDVLTLQVGANIDKEYLIAASVDLSTPLYSLAEDFKYMVSRLLKLPTRRDYDYFWY